MTQKAGQALENAKALYLRAIRDGDYESAINTYSGARYTQHSTPVRDGRAGFIEFFAGFVDRNPIRDIEIVRGFQDGQYVFLHVLQNLNDGEFQYVTADIFDTDAEAKLIEHWDIIEELRETTASGRTQLDGPTEAQDRDRSESNKALVTRYVKEVLVAGDYDQMDRFIAHDCAQHSPDLLDGRDVLQADARESGLRCVELHLVVGCGDLVATLAEVESNRARHAVIDLYRVEQDLIVEHWDVTEPITPEDSWVNSGKF